MISTLFLLASVILLVELGLAIWLSLALLTPLVVLFILIVRFFRNPIREVVFKENQVLAPCDGKVVVIEEVEEGEYFKDKRIQLSIFMSPLNVHVNRNPLSGVVSYFKYHPGKYLVAWHPKSSEENERTTVVIHTPKFGDILYRQIAGAMARRIVNYAEVGENVQQGEDSGFIKFGSRVDLLLPLNSAITVKLNQKVVGAQTCIATTPHKDEELISEVSQMVLDYLR